MKLDLRKEFIGKVVISDDGYGVPSKYIYEVYIKLAKEQGLPLPTKTGFLREFKAALNRKKIAYIHKQIRIGKKIQKCFLGVRLNLDITGVEMAEEINIRRAFFGGKGLFE
jgi:hypothetical protein